LGWAIFLNYGLTLMALPAVAVLVAVRNTRSTLMTLAAGAPAVVAVVVVVFAVAGFWWFDGYTLVQQRYWQGIASDRSFQYWSWANLASVVCAIGLGSVAGIARVFDIGAIRRRSGIYLLVLAALLAILCADVSMLSKAETERIWLRSWCGLPRPRRCCRPHLTDGGWPFNVLGAFALNSLILTNW